MIIFKHVKDISSHLSLQQQAGKIIGFAPTMGALHQGHISLVENARTQSDVVVSSIFVNPTQFNNTKDFEKYPITLEKDIAMLENAGCDILFLPTVKEMYPGGLMETKHFELGYLETVLEGAFRPGHFQGVCRVVEKLLQIVHPDKLFLGQKDYQQSMVIKKLVELMNAKTAIIICPTQREIDGLAMSSRNMRLTVEEKEKALAIYQSLLLIKEGVAKESPAILKQKAELMLKQAGLKTDYIEIADAKNLSVLHQWDAGKKAIALTAAFMNEVRLIDNMLL